MTLLLAVETATPRCSVALGSETGVLASSSVARDRRHVEAVVPAIAAACRSAGVALADVEALAVDVGPGLFTGMRVGIATVQGLALALGLPVHPVSSLEVLAHPLRHAARPVAAVVDARRGEVFRTLSRAGVELACAACTTPAALAEELAALGPCLAVGDGAVRYRAEIEAVGTEVVAAMPSAEVALELALAARAAGAPGLDPAEVEARYLRTADARANFTVLRPRAAAPSVDAAPSEPAVASADAGPFVPAAPSAGSAPFVPAAPSAGAGPSVPAAPSGGKGPSLLAAPSAGAGPSVPAAAFAGARPSMPAAPSAGPTPAEHAAPVGSAGSSGPASPVASPGSAPASGSGAPPAPVGRGGA